MLGGGLLGVSLAGCPTDPVPVDAPMTDAPGTDTRVDTGVPDGGGRDGGTDAGTDTGGGPVCGDGMVESPEVCDDDNTTPGDGCSATCAVETGFDCDDAEPTVCTAICGDGMVVGDERCDDMNETTGDGCDACAVEAGWVCPTGKACREIVCGDGNTDAPEACDDGNTDVETECDYGMATCADACNADCSAAITGLTGNVCGDGEVDADNETCDPPAAGTCSDTCQTLAVCGNGLIEGDETCDDNDVDAGDGCSDVCVVEAPFTCDGEPSLCSLTEIEPNEDGTPSTGGSTTSGNDFNATARMNADTNFAMIPLEASRGDLVVTGALTAGDEDVFAFENDAATPVELTVASWEVPGIGTTCEDADTVVRVFDDAGVSLDFDDDGGVNACSQLSLVIPAGETVYIHVMEYGDDEAIPAYAITVASAPVVCGDGVRNGAETCDDGDADMGDGCSTTCTVETGFVCPTPGMACRMITCGDGFRDGAEACDDGDTDPADGCSDTCTVESGFLCDGGSPSMCIGPATNGTCATAISVTADASFPVVNYLTGGPRPTGTGCGGGAGNTTLYYSVSIPAATAVVVTTTGTLDRVLMTQNACVDVNCASSTDSSPETVTLANGTAAAITQIVAVRPYFTGGPGSLGLAFAFSPIVCGDGVRLGAEACDDGDTDTGDGCSDTCTVEPNFTCDSASPSVCVPVPYIRTTIAAACADMTTATAVTFTGGTDDGTAARAALPTAFPFFGSSVSHYQISTNGFIGLFASDAGSIFASAGNPSTVPSTSTPNGYAAPFWDDLDMVSASTLDSGTHFVVQWTARLYNVTPTSNVVVQLHVYDTGVLEMHYCTGTGDAARIDGTSATIAVENLAGTAGVAQSVNTAAGITYGTTAFRFTPNP